MATLSNLLEKVKMLVGELLAFNTTASTISASCPTLCTTLLPFINNNTSLNLGISHLSHIVRGMIEGVIKICDHVTTPKMEAVYKVLYDKVTLYLQTNLKGDRENYYGLAFVILSFLEEVVKVFGAQKMKLELKLNEFNQ